MAENKRNETANGFYFRENFMSQARCLGNYDKLLNLLDMALLYAKGEKVEPDDPLLQMAFTSWKDVFDYERRKKKEYQERMTERAQKANSAKRAKRQQKPKETEFVEAEEEERFPFSEFWKLYDKDVNESECRFAWKHYSDETKGKIMNHVKAYVCAKRDKRYRKDPLNYLKQQTWLDEIIDTTDNNAAYGSNIKKSIREQEFERNVEVLKDTVARAERGEYAALDPFNAPAKEYWELQRDMENGGAT